MLALEGLRLAQGDFALSADLTVRARATVALIGPSGAGKSTLLAAIAGFLEPVAGRVLWDGADLGGLAPGERPVAMLFQEGNLFPHLSVAENVGLALAPRLRLSVAERQRVAEVLGQVGLEGFGDRLPGDLSGGQQSRAALARVLLQDRPLVLLDEPFAALGPGLRDEMLDLTAEMLGGAGRTLLLVSHEPREAARIAPETIFVAGGRAEAPERTEALLADPPPALRAYLGG